MLLKQGDVAPRNGFLVSRPNYQFYRERTDLSYQLEKKEEPTIATPSLKVETSLVEISLGLIAGAALGYMIGHH